MPETLTFNYAELNSRIINGGHFERSNVANELIRFASDSGALQQDRLLLSAIITGYEEAYSQQDYVVAHEFAVALYHLGDETEGPSRIAEACLILGGECLAKAEQAMQEGDYSRASNKAVWASERLSEARKYGTPGLDEALLRAARLTIEATARYNCSLKDTEDFEDPLLSDLTETEASLIKSEIVSLRQKLYEDCVTSDEEAIGPWRKWVIAYHHASVMEKYGQQSYLDLLNQAGYRAFEVAFEQKNYQMASYIASWALRHLTEEEQWQLIDRLPNSYR